MLNEIGALQKQMENEKASDLYSVKVVSELDDAKESPHKVAEEENSLRSLVEALKVEIENVKKEHAELKEKEAETESIAGNLHVKLRKTKTELEACLAEESIARGASNEMIATLNQLSMEIESARRDAEEMNIKAEEMKKEAETTKSAVKEVEKKLKKLNQQKKGPLNRLELYPRELTLFAHQHLSLVSRSLYRRMNLSL
ncbi:hypothetical protein RchiOBHm_Chr5g0076561 [Rosa chinensis]|uniref:WEB family protein n=1 Tax=Rosa chinensis TaxID=74649 RepID=A0A2P6QLS4_ROSCH|nr:hypothetical protein RchiOBHm_Chr5g0076561 [Rosa chinensis]